MVTLSTQVIGGSLPSNKRSSTITRREQPLVQYGISLIKKIVLEILDLKSMSSTAYQFHWDKTTNFADRVQ